MSDTIEVIEVIDSPTTVVEVVDLSTSVVETANDEVLVVETTNDEVSVVEATHEEVKVLEVLQPEVHVVEVVLSQGPQGPPGPGGSGEGQEFTQTVPQASWVFAHSLSRRPNVTIYINDIEVFADVSADATNVYIQFTEPTVGSVVVS